ncbi:unnamed protein product [Symbiodinium natans]|uniref:Integral membrane bound transporter domain-containing protein n=1 Tax=Symbiodinium natans TaxID=878477 RepID=A0A812PIP8_9DINO|nr:unnamed protein product [Symbiodinium natans]
MASPAPKRGSISTMLSASRHYAGLHLPEIHPEFRSDMTQLSKVSRPRMQTIWGMKVEWALRTSFAAALTATYAVHPEVQSADWDHATVFAPVLAIACVSGPNLGATLHHAWQMWTATVIGCFASMVVNETLRPVQPAWLRELLTCFLFLLTVFFLCSRPWALVQKRVSVGVMLCGTIPMSVSGHEKEWWFPWTTGTPCTVGLLASVLAMLLPVPHFAYRELRRRLAHQAATQRQVLQCQYHSVASASRAQHVAAAHLLEGFRDNLAAMRGLLSAAQHELFLCPRRYGRLKRSVTFFETQLTALRSLQVTAQSNTGINSATHVKFQKVTDSSWRASLKAVADAVNEVVTAEAEQPFDENLASELEAAQKALDDDVANARAEIVYPQGSLYNEDEHNADHFVEHINRMASYFALNELIVACVKMCKLPAAVHPPARRRLLQTAGRVRRWLSMPSLAMAKEAFKKTLSLGVLSIFAWIPEMREGRPEFMWGFIAACFVFSDNEGSSINTGIGRIVGTLFGGMVGLIALNCLSQLNVQHYETGGLVVYVIVCVSWTTFCSLMRSSPRHGYTATVAGFSIYIMVVGKLESFGQKTAHDVVLHRIQEQFIGASVYILVEMLLWRRSAREKVNDEQLSILRAIQTSFKTAVAPHLAFIAKQESKVGSLIETAKAERAGNQAVETAKSGLVAASSEPTFWSKSFPFSQYQRLLHSEEKALRLTHTLAAATRDAAIEEIDEMVPTLVASYSAAASKSLEAVIKKMEQWEAMGNSLCEICRFTVDSGAHAHGTLDLESTLPESEVIAAALALFDLQNADGLLRIGASKHFERFVATHKPTSNSYALSVNAMLFCLLNFTATMVELGDRLRVVQATERAVLHA